MRYHVEYLDPDLGRTFGIFKTPYDAKEKKLAAEGKGEVDHILYPFHRVVLLKDIKDVVEPRDPFGAYDEATGMFLERGAARQYVTIMEILHDLYESKLTGIQVEVGRQFSIGVGDGAAHYLVTKVGRTKCDVQWRGFCPDRYRDHHFMWGGSFPKKDVARYIDFERVEESLFPGNKNRRIAREKILPRLYKEFAKEYGFIPRDIDDYVQALKLQIAA